MTFPIPDDALSQHTAILGKTGSGKTSTSKLVVEHVVAQGFRVCILDSIKSDWWGITSSSDGRAPGLPFRILGGPRGHVPLHPSAGTAIGEIVGAGKLPLSILDMADFEMGGLQRFFIDFAPALMRSARGVVYLVMEEAHEFAPKERSGVGGESMATHWAKKLATAGRSKGIRLIVATQRVQALHNAVLGSCETVIAHRLTTPADQKPVVEWLGGHLGKDQQKEVASSLAALPTGTAWVCSGEAQVFEKIAFPKFSTFDNTVTPDRDGAEQKVTTAAVDQAELRAIVGDAVKEAEENDPKALKEEIARLRAATKDAQNIPQNIPVPDPAAIEAAEQRGCERGKVEGYAEGWAVATKTWHDRLAPIMLDLREERDAARDDIEPSERLSEIATAAARDVRRNVEAGPKAEAPRKMRGATAGEAAGVTRPQQRILDAIAWLHSIGHDAPEKFLVAVLADASPSSSSFTNNLGALRSAEFLDYPVGGRVRLTANGRHIASKPAGTPTHAMVLEKVCAVLSGPQQRILTRLAAAHPKPIAKEALADAVDASPSSSSYTNNLGRLRSLGLIDYPAPGQVRADDRLFPEISR